MNEIITVENAEMQIREYNGRRVVTFKDIDLVHQRPSGTASRNFRHNKKHFVENEDYILITKDSPIDEIRPLDLTIPPKGITLLTESGYLMIAKSFTDDLSWQVQRTLVNNYFKNKEQTIKENAIEPVLKDTKSILKCAKYPELSAEEVVDWKLNDLNRRVEILETELKRKPRVKLLKVLQPKEETWYEKNRNSIWMIKERMGIEPRKLYHIILDECSRHYDLEDAKRVYQEETGRSLAYAIDLVDYFPQLQDVADQVLDCYKL